MRKIRKYGLFVLYSLIGTGIDWLILILSSLAIKGVAFCTKLITILTTFTYDKALYDAIIKDGCSVANVISYAIGVALTFSWSAKYAFKVNDNMSDRIRNTIFIHVLGLLVQSGLFAVLIHNGFDEFWTKVITICENAVLMGAGNIFIVFRNYKKGDNEVNDNKKIPGTWVFSKLNYGYFLYLF